LQIIDQVEILKEKEKNRESTGNKINKNKNKE